MNIWIVTTGSSDVQLKTKDNWTHLFGEASDRYEDILYFEPAQPPNPDGDELFSVPARVMGMVYGEQLGEYYKDLEFPLLDAFFQKFKDEKVSLNRIIVILTNQEKAFEEECGEKTLHRCPYWQDTVTLKPILDQYFEKRFPRIERKYLELTSQSEHQIASGEIKGLDDWDNTLTQVQNLIKDNLSNIKDEFSKTIYVSHQAGTPAISSAVQFVCLASFGKDVQFLLSNEYKKNQDLIKSPKYLKGIKLQEAKSLLGRFDYEGLERLFSFLVPDWENSSDTNVKEMHDLLEVAMLWNCAEFEKFANARGGEAKSRLNDNKNWWWMAYEAAYLAVVRLKQGNVVEALFHSFRALEGLIKEWVLYKYHQQIQYSNPNQPNTPYFHDINLPSNLRQWFNTNRNNRFNNVGLFGKPLFTLLKESHKQRWNQNSDIQVVNRDIIDERNSTFHCLRGLQESDLFQAWNTQNPEDWEARVLGCLNFIAEFKPHPTSLEKASLMSQVHKELDNAIKQYESNEHTS